MLNINSPTTITKAIELPNWPVAFGGPAGCGKIRYHIDDFIVNELLAFKPCGSGEHVFLEIEKVGENTEYVARALARFAGIRQRDIGYAGLKDRHARTRQWFSVWLPGKDDLPWQDFASDSIKILSNSRHNKKLQRGALLGNEFALTIRNWQGDCQQTATILDAIKSQGLANYFGQQRFGRNGQNINQALAMFQGAKVKRQQRSLYLSAVRSFLFNEILAERIKQKNWQQFVAGDALMLDQSRSYFKTDAMDPALSQRVDNGELHPSGMLYGIGKADVSGAAAIIEQTVAERYPQLLDGLLQANVKLARRPLRVMVKDLHWQFAGAETLVLTFTLPAGSYATALLTEIITQEAH